MPIPSRFSDRRVLIAAAAGTAVVASLAYAGLRMAGHGGTRRPSSAAAKARSVEFPPPSPSLPATIKVTHSDTRDRTSMTLDLRPLSATGPQGYRISNARLRLVSRYDGAARDAEHPELSVQCMLTLDTSSPGALAVSKPGEFLADGASIRTRFAPGGDPPYSSKSSKGVCHETLRFKLDTPALVRLAAAAQATARFGVVDVKLSAAQLHDLREFAARMNPRVPL